MADWEPIIDEGMVAVYGVDSATLAANRRGQMTERQREVLIAGRRTLLVRRLLSPILTLILLVVLLVIRGNESSGFLDAVSLLVLAVLLLQAWGVFRFHRRLTREIDEGVVRMYAGRVVKRSLSAVRLLYCEYGEFPNLPLREWDAFTHRGRYRIFCTPRTHIILAAQPIHKDEPLPEAWSRPSDRA